VLTIEDRELGCGNVLVHSDHLKLWNISEEVLHEYARENTMKLRPFKLQRLDNLIEELCPTEDPFRVEGLPMYVLTNTERMFGASGLLYDRLLFMAGEELEDDYYILPSSIHELILVPQKVVEDPEYFEWMVHEINENELAPEDVLSDHVYFYDRSHHRLKDFTLKI